MSSSRHGRWRINAALAVGAALVSTTITTAAMAAVTDGQGPTETVEQSVIVIGKTMEQICEEDYGMGSEPVYSSETGEFDYCAVPEPLPPPTPPPPSTGGGDLDGNPSPDDYKNGGTPPSDECADDDSECICSLEEEEPEVCELSCDQCNADQGDCLDDAHDASAICLTNNDKKAAWMCQGPGGMRLHDSYYEDLASCVRGRTRGVPSSSSGSSTGQHSGWSVGANGGLKFGVGAEISGGISGSHNWGESSGTSQGRTWDSIPVDTNQFPDCVGIAGTAHDVCEIERGQCESNVKEGTGESCQEDTSYLVSDLQVYATFVPVTSAFTVFQVAAPNGKSSLRSRILSSNRPSKNAPSKGQ